jgi:hypothetical protein
VDKLKVINPNNTHATGKLLNVVSVPVESLENSFHCYFAGFLPVKRCRILILTFQGDNFLPFVVIKNYSTPTETTLQGKIGITFELVEQDAKPEIPKEQTALPLDENNVC